MYYVFLNLEASFSQTLKDYALKATLSVAEKAKEVTLELTYINNYR